MSIKAVRNESWSLDSYEPFLITEDISAEVKAFHSSFANYNRTELVKLDALAAHLGLSSLCVKDESSRFGLNSFKVLGAAYSVGKSIARELGLPLSTLTFEKMKELVKEKLGSITLSATTDGNHGRGVAWMGRQLGLPVKIFMPKGTTENRLQHILNEKADAKITDMNYDDTVRFVAQKSQEEGWLIIQDTAWEGYEDVPVWIMQGYSTLAAELIEQLGEEVPTHLFLQAGVGAFAGVMAEAFFNHYGKEKCPKIIVVEADVAACYYQSAIEKKSVVKTGDLYTIMAGLACGEPNPIGAKILDKLSYAYVSAKDFIAANGMRILSAPLTGDDRVVSGESGAVSIGIIEKLYTKLPEVKELLGLDDSSKVVTISTEGDTDKAVYRDAVWYGRYSDEA